MIVKQNSELTKYCLAKERLHMLTNHAKLMQFFSIASEVTGRKKRQKMIYILQQCHVPFEEKYRFHIYGPYSEELTLRSEEHTSELQSRGHLVCRLLLEKKTTTTSVATIVTIV